MGMTTQFLRLLAAMHARQRFTGPILTLGVQDVYATYDELLEMSQQAGLAVHPVPPDQRRSTSSLHLRKHSKQADSLAHAETLFRLWGLGPYESLDASPAEGPTLVHDLNQPVPPAWHGRYGLVIDGGTLEHIFDIRTALANVVRLLRVGGSVLHFSPVSGWVNHAFYQLSPCLFYDFYEANGFQIQECYALDLTKGPWTSTAPVPYVHTHSRLRVRLATAAGDQHDPLVNLAFLAEKREELSELRIPTQGKYRARVPAPVVAGVNLALAGAAPGPAAVR